VPTPAIEFVDRTNQHVQFPDRTQLSRHFSQLPTEVLTRFAIQFQKRHEFAEPPRRDARPVQGNRVQPLNAVQFARERDEPVVNESIGRCWRINGGRRL
jgi:hypothetical protein